MESVILEEVIEEIIDEESVRKAYLNIILLRGNIKTKEDCFMLKKIMH